MGKRHAKIITPAIDFRSYLHSYNYLLLKCYYLSGSVTTDRFHPEKNTTDQVAATIVRQSRKDHLMSSSLGQLRLRFRRSPLSLSVMLVIARIRALSVSQRVHRKKHGRSAP